MWDLVFWAFSPNFEYLAEELCWYLLEALDFFSEELLAFCFVFASFFEEFIGRVFRRIKVA